MKRFSWIVLVLMVAGVSSCGNFSKTVIYNEGTYGSLEHQRNVKVKFTNGVIKHFYKLNVVRTDEQFIYAQCWESQKSEPIDYKFDKSEVIIESEHFSGSSAGTYLLYLGLSVGVFVLIDLIFYN
ncbi:hypothetical protein K1X84_10650 [bacterium]|nr:hypothetical protein [bacterium]